MRRREVIALCAGLGYRPREAFSQAGSVRRLAYVHPATPVSMLSYDGARASGNKAVPAFLDELRRSGFVEGQNLSVARYSGQGQTDRYAQLAREVVASSPDAIFTMRARMVRYFKALTATIPIVALTSDPVANGFAESFARPGGNITGVVPEPAYSVREKRFRDDQGDPAERAYCRGACARGGLSFSGRTGVGANRSRAGPQDGALGVKSPINPAEYERLFKLSSAARVDGVMVGESAENFTHRALIARLAGDARLLGIYPNRNYAEAGGVIGYGPDYAELLRYAAAAIAKVFAGTPPGEIPFYQAQRFEVVLNLKAADEIGVKLPTSLLVRADEVIE